MSQGSPLSLFDKILYWVRLLLHLLLIGTTVWMADLEIRTALADPDLPDVAAALLGGGYGLAGVLGLVSLLSTFIVRGIHRAISSVFVCLLMLLVLLASFSDVVMGGWSSWAGDDPAQAAVMMAMLAGSAVTLGVEALYPRP
jgi:hypothetical protein